MKLDKKITSTILKIIKEYKTILIFRHESPDFDALGSQFGMYYYLKENFKDKNIYATGFSDVILADGLYPNNDILDDSFFDNNKFLAIVCDSGNSARISDQRYQKADKIIKIDHHPNKEPYGDINLVVEDVGSCCELIFHLLETFKKYKLNDQTAKYLFSGIVGDTGRFQFQPTNSDTFNATSKLVDFNFSIFDVYEKMYRKPISNIDAMQYVLNNYKITKHGVAYYILSNTALKKLNLDADEGKTFLSLFSSYDEIKVWVCIVQDDRKNNYRGSVRSKHIIINEVCAKYNGGGHKVAAGCRMKDLEEVDNLIKDLDKEIIKQSK